MKINAVDISNQPTAKSAAADFRRYAPPEPKAVRELATVNPA